MVEHRNFGVLLAVKLAVNKYLHPESGWKSTGKPPRLARTRNADYACGLFCAWPPSYSPTSLARAYVHGQAGDTVKMNQQLEAAEEMLKKMANENPIDTRIQMALGAIHAMRG